MISVIASFEGFSLRHTYIIKEATFLFPDGHYHQYLFAPPDLHLTPADRTTVQWTTRNLNGLHWEDGLLPYHTLPEILQRISSCCRIYAHGSMARKFLAEQLPRSLIVDTSLDGKYPATLRAAPCGRDHNPRYCSLAKALYIRDNFVN